MKYDHGRAWDLPSEKLIKPRMKHIFDLDHTLLTVNISYEFGRHLYRRGWISPLKLIALLSLWVRHKYLSLSMAKLHRKTFNLLLQGVKMRNLHDEVPAFLEKLPTFLYPPAINRLTPDSLILSSSPDFLVVPIAQRLGVEGMGSIYVSDSECRLLDGPAKAKLLPPGPCTYYTDSILDLPVLEAAHTCVAVQPDRSLRRLAHKRGWEII